MPRAVGSVPAHRRRKRLLRRAKGFRGSRRTNLRKAKETVMRALAYRTRDRKTRKRSFRQLWIIRLNAAARARGLTYHRLLAACRRANIRLNRQQLSELAIHDTAAFDALVQRVTAQ